MAKVKVFKVKTVLPGHVSRWGGPDDYFLCSVRGSDREPYPLGKVVLSLRWRKGRRRLVRGEVKAEPDSHPEYGLSWDYLFTPSNACQMSKLEECLLKS